MYTVNRTYSEPQGVTIVQIEFKSVDSSDYEYFVKTIKGDVGHLSDEEVTKIVLDKMRVKLNPNEAVLMLDDKMAEMDNVVNQAKQAIMMSEIAVLELMEVVYELMDAFMLQGENEEPELPTEPEGPADPEVPIDPDEPEAPGEPEPGGEE